MPPRTRGFAHRIDIAASPMQVWTALSGPGLVAQWLGADARVTPRQGGSWAATVAPGLARDAMIDLFEPPRRLRLIYLPPPGLPVFDGAVVDDILLDGEGEGTIVRLLCSGVPDLPEWTPVFSKLRATSERALSRLKRVVEERERMATAGSTT
jgi:uncharacterized protein YndB with AHSA1/START domain